MREAVCDVETSGAEVQHMLKFVRRAARQYQQCFALKKAFGPMISLPGGEITAELEGR